MQNITLAYLIHLFIGWYQSQMIAGAIDNNFTAISSSDNNCDASLLFFMAYEYADEMSWYMTDTSIDSIVASSETSNIYNGNSSIVHNLFYLYLNYYDWTSIYSEIDYDDLYLSYIDGNNVYVEFICVIENDCFSSNIYNDNGAFIRALVYLYNWQYITMAPIQPFDESSQLQVYFCSHWINSNDNNNNNNNLTITIDF